MMHSRGRAGNMHEENLKVYRHLEAEVAAELQGAADSAVSAGVRSWNIMLDPGIGFGKSPPDNLRLLRAVHRIRGHLQGMYLSRLMAVMLV